MHDRVGLEHGQIGPDLRMLGLGLRDPAPLHGRGVLVAPVEVHESEIEPGRREPLVTLEGGLKLRLGCVEVTELDQGLRELGTAAGG